LLLLLLLALLDVPCPRSPPAPPPPRPPETAFSSFVSRVRIAFSSSRALRRARARINPSPRLGFNGGFWPIPFRDKAQFEVSAGPAHEKTRRGMAAAAGLCVALPMKEEAISSGNGPA
jgi:hypothetical protein